MEFKDTGIIRPKNRPAKMVVSTWYNQRDIPIIEMEMQKEIFAKVTFSYEHASQEVREDPEVSNQEFPRILSGPTDKVYKAAAKICSQISLTLEREFNTEWNRALVNLLNKPSKNKRILNLGVYKDKSKFGLYDIKTQGELLQEKLFLADITGKSLAAMAGVNEATLYRHLKNDFDISKEQAIKYAKVLGCDPAELIFNPLIIPVWGDVDTTESIVSNPFQIYASEVRELEEPETVKCPRELFRPDIKAVRLSGSASSAMFSNHTAFYYDNPSDQVEGKICVVGARIKDRRSDVIRQRYFVGAVEFTKDGKVNLKTIEPSVTDISGYDIDEDFNTAQQAQSIFDDMYYIIKDIEPNFISPVISIVENNLNEDAKQQIIKAYDSYYTKSRMSELEQVDLARNRKIRAAIKGLIIEDLTSLREQESIYDDDVAIDRLAEERLNLYLKNDKRFRSILNEIGKGKYTVDKKMKSKPLMDLEKLNEELSKEELKIVQTAHDKIIEDYEHEEGMKTANEPY